MSEKASKGTGFLNPRNSKTTVNEGKRKEQKKERGEGKEEKRTKATVALLVFIIANLEMVFGQKKLLNAQSPFGDNVIKNPARYYFAGISISN